MGDSTASAYALPLCPMSFFRENYIENSFYLDDVFEINRIFFTKKEIQNLAKNIKIKTEKSEIFV